MNIAEQIKIAISGELIMTNTEKDGKLNRRKVKAMVSYATDQSTITIRKVKQLAEQMQNAIAESTK